MTMVTEPPRLTGVLKYEEDPSYCREQITVKGGIGSDRVLTIGQIVEASGDTMVALTTATATPVGVLICQTTAPVGVDTASVMLARGPAIVSSLGLIYPPGATTNQKSVINTALAGLGIVVRQGV